MRSQRCCRDDIMQPGYPRLKRMWKKMLVWVFSPFNFLFPIQCSLIQGPGKRFERGRDRKSAPPVVAPVILSLRISLLLIGLLSRED
ncbi:hypothetical protein L873DRAFT_105500 [Choiromyces venosus 120613-1]|uniref:Uncharacterized protein n=1 Tax=Choiromyces venosus 120613-1 TaxID=1336337 RepID=A0A3N4JZU1_9PEZI|nr:hypothetical protein L873DRAFT_105500 [Choiromyces venosus 120613-1]